MKLTDIKKSYHSTKQLSDRNDLWLYYVIRKISFYITWIFLKFGFSANQTTYIAIIVGLTGCGFIIYPDYKIKIIGTLLINFWIVLDCVDGNIARYKKKSSEYGEFIDSLGGYLMNALLFLSVGIGAFNYPEFSLKFISRLFVFNNGNMLIILGAWSSIANILSRLIFQKYMNTFRTVKSTEIKPRSNANSSKSVYHKMYFIIHNIVSFSGFLTPILFLATIFRLLNIFVIFYAIINTGVLIATTSQIILKARRIKK